jgi:putative heme-binding domain-containing protein
MNDLAGAGSASRMLVDDLIARALKDAKNASANAAVRAAAIRRLGRLTPLGSREVLVEMLEPNQPEAVQVAAISALAECNAPESSTALIERLRGFTPAVRPVAVRALLGSQSWTRALLLELTKGDPVVGANLIDLNARGPLLKHGDAEIKRLAGVLFGKESNRSRRQVLEEYRDVIAMKGDPRRGVAVFDRVCKGCHKVDERGYALGPDLTGSASADASALLANILDPNAQVLPNYIQYTVVDHDGRTASGMIAAENATGLTLRRAEGVEETILRTRIAEMTSTGQSLMPEGLEKTISKNEMADLIAYLRGTHRGGSSEASESDSSRPLDIGTLPGLIEPD